MDGVRAPVVCSFRSDALPPAGAATIRRVLQHLSSHEIASALKQCGHYHFLIVTEELPAGLCRNPNLDQPHDPNTWLESGSGVFLEHPPFSLKPEVLSELPALPGAIMRTIVIENPPIQ